MDDRVEALQVIGASLIDDIRSTRVEGIDYIEPRDLIEFHLIQAWKEILDISLVGLKDNFFELGGNSILAARLLVEIEKMSGIKYPMGLLFDTPTVEQMGEVIRKGGWRPPSTSLVALQPKGNKPPFFLVAGMGKR